MGKPKYKIADGLTKDIEKVFRGSAAICRTLEVSEYIWKHATTGNGIRDQVCMNTVKEFFRIIYDDKLIEINEEYMFNNVVSSMRVKYQEFYDEHNYDNFVVRAS